MVAELFLVFALLAASTESGIHADPNSAVNEEIDELAAGLGEYCEEYEYAVMGMLTGGFGPPIFMRGVLVDPRVTKLHQVLNEKPKDDAAKETLRIFKETLREFEDGWGAINTRDQSERYQLMALLFLVERFCSESDFDEQCQEWARWHFENIELSRQFKHDAGPQTLFIINLYADLMVRRGESVANVDKRIKKLCEDLGAGGLPELNMRVLKGVDESDTKAKDNVVAFEWCAAEFYNDLETRKKAVAAVRKWLKK